MDNGCLADFDEAHDAQFVCCEVSKWIRPSAQGLRRRPSPSIGAALASRFCWPACAGEAISLEVFGRCQHILLSPQELEAHQQTMAAAKSSISVSEWGDWNEHALARKGFKVLDRPAIVAVAEPDGRFALQFVFLPKTPCQHAMANLADRVFDEYGRPTASKTRGQTHVKARGDKQFAGTMLMYGIKCQPHNTEYARRHGLCCTSVPCLYNIGAPPNSELDHLWQQHLK